MAGIINEDTQGAVKQFEVKSDPWTAATEWFNILFVAAGLASFGIGLVVAWAVAVKGSVFLAVYSTAIALLGLAFLVLQLWGMLTLAIKGDSERIVYRVSYRRILVEWNSVRSVKIENWKRQVTFQTDSGVKRVHWFGVAPSDCETFRNMVRDIAAERGLKCN